MNDDQSTTGAAELERVIFEVKKVIVGQDRAVERLLVGLLARGHCLLEGLPGLAKTLAAETLARAVGGTFHRIQFTPDLLPADVVGTRVYRASTETFDVELGPVFANFVLADEINRAPAKVQSALLEVMAEGHVTIGGTTYDVPKPFLVLATQNPIESEGVYQLPEAQRDRFLFKILLDYPSATQEIEIVTRMGVEPPEATQVITPEHLMELQSQADRIYVDIAVVDYAVRLVLATRYPQEYGLEVLSPYVTYGGSPRASLGLVAAGRALALLRGRPYVLPQDVFDVAPDVLRHRIVPSYEALAESISTDQILAKILSTVPAPRISPSRDGVYPHLTPAAPSPQAQAAQLAHAQTAQVTQAWAAFDPGATPDGSPGVMPGAASGVAHGMAPGGAPAWNPPGPDPFAPAGSIPTPWAPPAPGHEPAPVTSLTPPPPPAAPQATQPVTEVIHDPTVIDPDASEQAG